MTTKSKFRNEPMTAPTMPRSRAYRDDLYGWVEDQVALLKAGRLSEIDAENIADELGDVGKSEYDKLQSAVRLVLLHLLKWDHQPTHRSRSWVLTIRVQRRQIDRVLRKNPSLKPWINEATNEGYEDARDEATNETGLAAAEFPPACPYDWSAITTRPLEWDDLRTPQD